MRKLFFFGIAIFISQIITLNVFSQTNSDDAVLFTVGGKPVSKSEFLYVYQKNNPNKQNDFSRASLQEYLDLYINFKLKVAEAKALQIDTTQKVREELDKYGEQLIKSNFDKEVLESAMRLHYERMKTERLIYHVMAAFEANAAPADTLAAYNTIQEAKKRLDKGEQFEKVASELSSDMNGRNNGGRVGWITGFSIPDMAFEDMAYNTKIGGISPAFRSKYGYHILTVKQERPASGDVKVEHLLVRFKPNSTAQDSMLVKSKIDSIARVVASGQTTFEEMVVKFSEDINTKNRNGELDWFGVGKMAAPFEEAAFSIKNIGEVSNPVLTAYGWHLIKLIDKRELQPYEDIQADIKSRIERTAQYRDLRNAYVAKVKAENNFTENAENKNAVLAMLDSSFIANTWKPGNINALNKPVFTIGDQDYTQAQLALYLNLKQKTFRDNNIEVKFNKIYSNGQENVLIEYQLGKEDPNFKRLMQEYREGIPLFALLEQKVWTAAAKDSIGLETYYEAHKEEYMWGERVDATIYDCADETIAKEIRKAIKKKKTNEEILSQFNTDSTFNVFIDQNLFLPGQNSNVDMMNKSIGISENILSSDGTVMFVKINSIVPPQPKTLKEARGYVISGYQDQLEKQWMQELHQKYPVNINQDVFNSMVK